KIKEISIQQQQNRKSRLKLALPKIIDELKNLQTSYKSLKRILDDPKREEILTQFEMTSYKRNDSFVTAARIPPLILTTKYAENKMRELFKDIQSDLDRIIMENTINHPHWAWEHFEFCIKNKNNLQLIRDRVDSMDFSVQLQYCDFLIEYYESALADVKSN
ncbi:MAG: hypothetical protein OEY54_05545, partial [Nitrosopumilus sp.]|nr:hypothetical protein [Nitrosopumilus sp.]